MTSLDSGVAGMQGVLDAEGAFGRATLKQLIVETGRRKYTFTADDLDHELIAPASPNALSAMFGHLARQGVIEEVGVRRSTRPEARGRLVRVWVLRESHGAS